MIGHTVTLVTRTRSGVDSDGNDVLTETPTDVAGCVVWPRGSSELLQGQDTTIAGLWVLFPAGTTVTAIDAVIVDGDTWEVDGDPEQHRSPFTGRSPGVVVALSKVRG